MNTTETRQTGRGVKETTLAFGKVVGTTPGAAILESLRGARNGFLSFAEETLEGRANKQKVREAVKYGIYEGEYIGYRNSLIAMMRAEGATDRRTAIAVIEFELDQLEERDEDTSQYLFDAYRTMYR